MKVIARLEYELVYYDSAVHRFNYYTTRTPHPRKEKRKRCWREKFIHHIMEKLHQVSSGERSVIKWEKRKIRCLRTGCWKMQSKNENDGIKLLEDMVLPRRTMEECIDYIFLALNNSAGLFSNDNILANKLREISILWIHETLTLSSIPWVKKPKPEKSVQTRTATHLTLLTFYTFDNFPRPR